MSAAARSSSPKIPRLPSGQAWLVKAEPEAYSWETFEKEGVTSWDGVRNYQARNNLRAMKVGDPVFFYASVTGKEIQGLAEVSKAAYPDSTADEGDWSSVQLKAKRALKSPVTLATIKATATLKEIALLRQSRISVVHIRPAEFAEILRLAGE